MTVRIFGAILIGAASLYTGAACASVWKKRAALLTSFCRLLSALEDGISVMGLPMQQIVVQFSDPLLEQTGFLARVHRLWQEDPYADALCTALAEPEICRCLEDVEYRLLYQFFEQLGTEDRIREGARCAYVRTRLGTIRDEALSALTARCRIARTLSGAIGCAAALMLL